MEKEKYLKQRGWERIGKVPSTSTIEQRIAANPDEFETLMSAATHYDGADSSVVTFLLGAPELHPMAIEGAIPTYESAFSGDDEPYSVLEYPFQTDSREGWAKATASMTERVLSQTVTALGIPSHAELYFNHNDTHARYAYRLNLNGLPKKSRPHKVDMGSDTYRPESGGKVYAYWKSNDVHMIV